MRKPGRERNTDGCLDMTMPMLFTRLKKATTAFYRDLQLQTPTRKALPSRARPFHVSLPLVATTPLHCLCFEVSTAHTVRSVSFISTPICMSLFLIDTVLHSLLPSDTWKPKVFGGAPTKQASINHGTYFYHAHEEGLLANDTNIHAGIRTTLSGLSDYDNDGYCGFEIVEAREIDTIGMQGIIKKIRDRVGTKKPVYLSIDIDTLDPACMYHFLPSIITAC